MPESQHTARHRNDPKRAGKTATQYQYHRSRDAFLLLPSWPDSGCVLKARSFPVKARASRACSRSSLISCILMACSCVMPGKRHDFQGMSLRQTGQGRTLDRRQHTCNSFSGLPWISLASLNLAGLFRGSIPGLSARWTASAPSLPPCRGGPRCHQLSGACTQPSEAPPEALPVF